MSDITVVFLIVLGTIALFVWNRLPVVVVAVGSALALYLTGLLTLEQSLAGFGDPVVIFIAALFVVAAGLEATGVSTDPITGSARSGRDEDCCENAMNRR